MICIKADIPRELNEIDDELKAIYHSKDTVCFFILKTRELRNKFIEETKGLGWISGKVSKIDNQNGKYKLPHIGWNQISIVKESKIFRNIENNSHMYFVHSYEFIPNDKNVISATTDYSSNIVCSVEKENIFGTQFHPEKSDKMGLKIISNFINL